MLIPQISSLLLLQEKKYTTHRKGFEITVCESKGRGYFDPFLTTATLEIIVHKPKFDSSSKVKLQTSIVRKKKTGHCETTINKESNSNDTSASKKERKSQIQSLNFQVRLKYLCLFPKYHHCFFSKKRSTRPIHKK